MHYSREILHIDDDPQFTRLVSGLLGDRGFTVAPLNDPSVAIDELVRSQRRIVLLDIDMRAVDGLTLLRDIKNFDSGIQVIMLTGMVSLSTVLQSERWGAEACFFKPLESIEPLVEALDAVYRKFDRWWAALDAMASHRAPVVPRFHTPSEVPLIISL